MKDKILKQIEEEAKKRLPKLWDRMSHETFIEGAKFGYNIKDSVDVEMSKNIEIVLPSATSACKYDVQVKSMVGEILFEHTFYGDSRPVSIHKESVDEKLELSIVNKLYYLESIGEYSVPTDTVRAWIDLAKEDLLSASQNTVSNEGEKERLIDFLCYLNNNKMINNYDFDYEQEASEYLSKINPPKEK